MKPSCSFPAFMATLGFGLLISATPAHAGPGTALSFNGTNNYVNATIPALGSNYTICAWVYLRSGGDFYSTLLGVLTGTACNNSVEFLIRGTSATNPQYLELGRCGSFSGRPSAFPVPLNQWLHVAVSVSSNRSVIYCINGTNAGSVSIDYGYNMTLGPAIHLGDNAVRKFNGNLDEVQIWNRVLSEAEIQAGMNQAPNVADANLVAYWPFNEGTGTAATADASGHGHTGTLTNAPAWVLSTIPFTPDAATAAVSAIGFTSATLNGTVNPGNLATAAWFQWGTTTSYGNVTAVTHLSATNLSFSMGNVLTGLTPGQIYHARLVTTNNAGAVAGGDVTWTNLILPPAVTTLAASGIGFTRATLNGTVNPNGLSTTTWFEWGATTNYGNVTAATSLAATNASLPVSAALSGLTPGQTVHFRVAATNIAGMTTGADQTFTTRTGTNTVTTLADSGAGSLRQTIADSLDGDLILFATNGTITLTSGEIVITNSLTLTGPGATNLAVSGNNASRVFNISSTNATVTISGLTIRDGRAPSGGSGGGIYSAGILTLAQCVVTNNASGNGGDGDNFNGNGTSGGNGGNGGGVYDGNTLTLTACLFSANTGGNGGNGGDGANNGGNGGYGGHGGAVYSAGSPRLTDCTFNANVAGNGGTGGRGSDEWGGNGGNGGHGGGFFSTGSPTVIACTFGTNTGGAGGAGGTAGSRALGCGTGGAGGTGGGVYVGNALTLTACTFSGNTGGHGGVGGSARSGGNGGPGGGGGGVLVANALTLTACTFSGNKGGHGGDGGAGSSTSGYGGAGGGGGYGGGIYNPGGSWSVTLRNGLFALNQTGSGGAGGANSTTPGSPGAVGYGPDLGGAFTSAGHNLLGQSEGSSGLTNGINGDLVGTTAAPIDPLLGPLADNGGPTFTMALGILSPAFDAGDDSLSAMEGTEQRGLPRRSGAHVDIGAYELMTGDFSAPSVTLATCMVTNHTPGIFSAHASFTANPNGPISAVCIEFGLSTNYGITTGWSTIGYGTGPVPVTLPLTPLAQGLTYHYRVVATNYFGITHGADQSLTTGSLYAPGDLNGDGVVDLSELSTVLANYWPTSPWLQMTNAAGLGGTNITFALTNATAGAFSVESSTNLADWEFLGPATPRYEFSDTNAPAVPQRFYRLRWP